MTNDELRTRLWLIGHQMLLIRQITVAVNVGVTIRAIIRQIGKQVLFVVVRTESTLFLLHGVHLKTNSQVCGHIYLNRNYQEHLVKFKADAAIDYVCKGFTIVHAQVILVLEAVDLGLRNVCCHSLVPHNHRVVHSLNGLGCVAYGKQVNLRAEAIELDYRIALDLVLEVTHFSGVKISSSTSEIRKVAITYLAKVESISEVKAQDDLVG